MRQAKRLIRGKILRKIDSLPEHELALRNKKKVQVQRHNQPLVHAGGKVTSHPQSIKKTTTLEPYKNNPMGIK
jgi:hypothetical protein